MQAHVTFNIYGFLDKAKYPYGKTLTIEDQKEWEEQNRTVIRWDGCLNFPIYNPLSQKEEIVTQWFSEEAAKIVRSILETSRDLEYENNLGLIIEKEDVIVHTFKFESQDGEHIDGISDSENIIVQEINLEVTSVVEDN